MRIGKVLRIIIWSAMALVLILVLLYGLRGEGLNLSFLGNAWSSFSYADSETYHSGNASFSKNQRIDSIEVNWMDGSANIRFYEGDTITFSETALRKLDDDETLRYKVQDNKLIIQFRAPIRGFTFSGMPSKKLDLRIPSSLRLKELKITGISGALTAEGNSETAYADSLGMETISGNIDISGISGETLRLTTVSGRMTGEGSFEEVRTNSISGEITLTLATMPDVLRTESISGDVRLALPDKAFAAKMDSVSGRISCDYAGVAQNKSLQYLEGGPTFRFESISGSVYIERWDPPVHKENIRTAEPSAAAPSPSGATESEITGGGRKF